MQSKKYVDLKKGLPTKKYEVEKKNLDKGDATGFTAMTDLVTPMKNLHIIYV